MTGIGWGHTRPGSQQVDATQIAGGTVNNTEFSYLSGVRSDIQAQLDAIASGVPLFMISTDGTMADNSDSKVPSQSAVRTYVADNVVASTGAPAGTPVNPSAAEIGYVQGVTSSIQSQINAKIPTTYLDTDGTLTANSNTKIATQQATKTYADTLAATKAPAGSPSNPSATEIGYVKGVTSGVQTQLDAKIPASYLDTDGTLSADSNTRIATQKAVKAYADSLASASGAMVFKNTIDCSTNPNYPAANQGDTYLVSVQGKIGGAAGVAVTVNSLIICLTNGTPSGTQAAVGSAWTISPGSVAGTVIGPASAPDSDFALFDGPSGTLLKPGGTLGSLISGATAKVTPIDADTAPISDSAAAGVVKKVTWANIKATLKTYFDGIYTLALLGGVPTSTTVNTHALTGNVTVTATDVGLGNVTNVAQMPLTYLDTDGTLAANSATKVASQSAVVTRLGGAGAPSATELGYVKGATSALQTQLGTKMPLTYLSTDSTFASPSDVTVPSTQAVKSYVATLSTVTIGALPTYADNATALAAGATVGSLYKTTTGAVFQVYYVASVPGPPYGNIFRNVTGLGNIPVGVYDKASFRVKAEASGSLAGISCYWMVAQGSGYSAGNGGILRCDLYADDGTANHYPTGSSLASFQYTVSANQTSHTAAAIFGTLINGCSFVRLNFTTPYTITSGTIYHVVFTNLGASPSSNYYSVDCIVFQNPTTPQQPTYSDSDLATLIYYSGAWHSQNQASPVEYHTPIYTLWKSDNTVIQGQPYIDLYGGVAGISVYSTTHKVRQKFIPSAEQIVTGVNVQAFKSGSPPDMTVTLQDASFSTIITGTIAASSYPTSVSDAHHAKLTFGSPGTLSAGTTYYLEISAPTGNSSNKYLIQGSQNGYGYGMYGHGFFDGAQSGNPAALTTDGTNWTTAPERDLAVYFDVQ